MTDIRMENRKCCVCRHESKYSIVYSYHFFGVPDLDGYCDDGVLGTGIDECSKCGYISYDVSKETDISKNWDNIKKRIKATNHIGEYRRQIIKVI